MKQQEKKYAIDAHPHKEEILSDLLIGISYRNIADKYGISIAAISRYMQNKLAPKLAKELIKKDELDQEFIVTQLDLILSRQWAYADAIDAELQNPEDPEKYYLGPRASDIDVVYSYKNPKCKLDEPPRKGKAKLQELLNRISAEGYKPLSVDIKIADPRLLHIRNTESITKTLDTFGRIIEQIKEIDINLTQTEEWSIIKAVLIEATENYPEVRTAIIEGLRRVDSGA